METEDGSEGHPAAAAGDPLVLGAEGADEVSCSVSQHQVGVDLSAVVTSVFDRSQASTPLSLSMGMPAILTELARRSASSLTPGSLAGEYLISQGVVDPKIWAAYRLGAGHPSVADGIEEGSELWMALRDIGLASRRAGVVMALPGGLNLPTFDPRAPQTPVAVVRMTPGQNRHGYLATAAGIGCTASLAQSGRVVLVDGPLTGLRLVQAGARDVALVEDPATLTPLADWLAQRVVVIAGYRRDRIEAIRQAMGAAGRDASSVVVTPDIVSSPAATLLALGITRESVVAPKAKPALTDRMLSDLHRYARERVRDGDACSALRQLDDAGPDLVNAYDIGYLPSSYLEAMPTDMQAALRGHRLEGCLIIPAKDEGGVIVDLLAVRPEKNGKTTLLLPEPRGLLGGSVATAYTDFIVTDHVRGLVRLYREGHRNVLLLRGAVDARTNAARLRTAGVESIELRVRSDAAEITAALKGGWISVRTTGQRQVPAVETVTVSAPPASVAMPTSVTVSIEPLELVEHDRHTERATFKAGATVYVVEVPWDGDAKLEVTLRHGASKVHRDTVDLASEAGRKRFASASPLYGGLPSEVVEAHLLALLDLVRALQREADPNAVPLRPSVVGAERDEAMAMLTDPKLLDRIMADLDQLGWVGELDAKVALYLAGVSRLLAQPLWMALMATFGAGKSYGIQVIADLTPPEDLVQVTLLTNRSLYHQAEHALRHKLLVIDEADALTAEVISALKTLKTRGGLSMRQALPSGSGMRSRQVDAHGPVALLTSTAGRLDDQLQSRCLVVPVDESPEQTSRIHAAQARLAAAPSGSSSGAGRAAILLRHRNLQRLLEHRDVTIPFAERIGFPASSLRHRRAYSQFLDLIRASALLHQHQRLTDQGLVVASELDFSVATRVATAMGIAEEVEMGRGARQLLAILRSEKTASFTVADVGGLLPMGTAYAVRAAITELVRLGFVEPPPGGRGKTGSYRLTPMAIQPTGSIRLLAIGEVREPRSEVVSPRSVAG